MYVVDQRTLGSLGNPSTDQQGTWSVSVNRFEVTRTNDIAKLADDFEIKLTFHRNFEQLRFRLPNTREFLWFQTGEPNIVPKFRKLQSEQVLHTFGAGEMLAIDQVQNVTRFCATLFLIDLIQLA